MSQFIQESEPTTGVLAFDEWCNPVSGNIKIRNSLNTAWTLYGNVDVDRLGLASRSGYTASGNITGVTDWATLNSPAFTTSATIDGINIATVNNVTNAKNMLNAIINSRVTTAINSYQRLLSVSDSVALGSGVLQFAYGSSPPAAQTIPLPVFASDSVEAEEDQCAWMVAPTYFALEDDTINASGLRRVVFSANPITNRTFYATTYSEGASEYRVCHIGYIIIGVR